MNEVSRGETQVEDLQSTSHVYNELGIIAEHYRDLQGLPVLEAARQAYPLPKASDASAIRAVFQAAEIAILNLADVVGRAAADVERDALARASVKILWARGFHRVLLRLSVIPHQLGLPSAARCEGRLRIADSPALQEYGRVLARFDREVLARVGDGTLDLEETLRTDSLESAVFALVHAARVSSHDTTIWERNLSEVPVSAPVPSYAEFVVARTVRDAVYDRVLKGDTYFTQFRGLHQIPETLGEEANDHLEQAIRDINADRLSAALAHLRCATTLIDSMLASLPPMADNLATSDYHVIRENLGLTSGSHSVCLRFHMFTDLYTQLAKAIERGLVGSDAMAGDADAVAAAVRAVDDARLDDPAAWLYHQLVNEGLAVRSSILQWREQHLHLPRNNLGGGYTKSLTGSPDAVLAVKKMRRAARASDPMLNVARARGLAGETVEEAPGSLAEYLESDESLDSRILQCTGQVTQRRFVAVQERLGFFANRCPFAPPPHRLA
jgi:tryptophan 2,3-dioxygenase